MNSDSPNEAPLGGMTTNERLFSRGLLFQFAAAAHRRDLPAMVGFLRESRVLGGRGVLNRHLSPKQTRRTPNPDVPPVIIYGWVTGGDD